MITLYDFLKVFPTDNKIVLKWRDAVQFDGKISDMPALYLLWKYPFYVTFAKAASDTIIVYVKNEEDDHNDTH